MGMREERKFILWFVECERSGAHLEIPYLFLLTDFECGTRNLSTKVFPLRRSGLRRPGLVFGFSSLSSTLDSISRINPHIKANLKKEKAHN